MTTVNEMQEATIPAEKNANGRIHLDKSGREQECLARVQAVLKEHNCTVIPSAQLTPAGAGRWILDIGMAVTALD